MRWMGEAGNDIWNSSLLVLEKPGRLALQRKFQSRAGLWLTDADPRWTMSSSFSRLPRMLLILTVGIALGASTSYLLSHRRRRRTHLEKEERALPEEDIVDGVEGLVGNTKLVRIRSLSRATGCEILAKAEVPPFLAQKSGILTLPRLVFEPRWFPQRPCGSRHPQHPPPRRNHHLRRDVWQHRHKLDNARLFQRPEDTHSSSRGFGGRKSRVDANTGCRSRARSTC